MKVLQVTAVDFTLKKFLLPLIDEMIQSGYEVHTACNRGEASAELEKSGYIIHHIPFTRDMNALSHLKSLRQLIRLLNKEKYDCIHTHTPVASIVARLAAKIARVPVIIYTAHGFYFHENMKPHTYKVFYWLEKIWGRFLSNYLLFQSKEDYDLAYNHKFQQPDRLLYIGNGVSSERFDPGKYDREQARAKLGFGKNDIVLMFVGRFVKEKGVTELLEAFDQLKKEGFDDLKLMLAGGQVAGDRDSVDFDSIVSSLHENTKKDLTALGLRDDIPELLSASDVFVLPSYREGLPRSIIEAMAMGKPIIATDIRGCREEVFPGINGYLCKAKSADDLSKTIKKLITSKESMEHFGRASKELFHREFDEKLVLERQIELFNRIRKENTHVQKYQKAH